MTRLTTLIATAGIVVATTAPASASASVPDRVTADPPTCFGQAATIVGTDGADVLKGTFHQDVIVAGAGDDVVDGAGGDDFICGGDGDDRLSGGSGKDTIDGENGNDVVTDKLGYGHLFGGPGADRLTDSDPHTNAYLDGGTGDDVVRGCQGVINADPGQDRLIETCGNGIVYFADRTNGTPIDVDLREGVADNAVTGHDTLVGIVDVVGTPANDRIAGNDKANMIFGGDGNDVLIGRGGDDELADDEICTFGCLLAEAAAIPSSPSGRDVLRGGSGDDRFDMKGGADVVSGGRGHDRFDTASIMSTVKANLPIVVDLARGFFQWHGETGTLRSIEIVDTTRVADHVRGDGHANRLLVGGGDDVVRGRGGNDYVRAGHGHDAVNGGGGFDVCVGAEIRKSCERHH